MKIFDEIKLYLPKYLSADALEDLFKNLKDFPNINERLYTGILPDEDDLFQGDGLRKMLVINLPNPDVAEGPVMVLSNTCDTSFENPRLICPAVIYCPIVKLSKYLHTLRSASVSEAKLVAREDEIKRQRVSEIFFLPETGGLPEDCVALLSHVNSSDMDYLNPYAVKEKRLFSLSNTGLFFFVFKLGIHFTRIREQIDRK
ncbi:MAG: hypothetical protein M3449_04245 [Acidobacteriota bacterium]|nr:hypothetical protein [Acidobacteriota bacterium]